jgi:transcriptional regulator with XRE-family HTH domain
MTHLHSFRVALGLTVDQAADVVGVSQPTYRKMERGLRLLDHGEARRLLDLDVELLAWFSSGEWSPIPGAAFAALLENFPPSLLHKLQRDLPRVGRHLAQPGQVVQARGQSYLVASVEVGRGITYQPGDVPSSIVTGVES